MKFLMRDVLAVFFVTFVLSGCFSMGRDYIGLEPIDPIPPMNLGLKLYVKFPVVDSINPHLNGKRLGSTAFYMT